MISHKYKAVYIRIPKVASTSLAIYFEKFLAGFEEDKILEYSQFLRVQRRVFIQNYFYHYFTFTFVRNPFDRFVSTWLNRCNTLKNHFDIPAPIHHHSLHSYAELAGDILASLESWDGNADYFDSNEKMGPHQIPKHMLLFEHIHLRRQKDYLLDCNPDYYFGVKRFNNAPCSFIGRFENLAEDLRCLMDILGAPQKSIPKKNFSAERLAKGARKHYSDYYDQATRRLVEDLYTEDLDVLGYEFENRATKTILNPLYDTEVAAKRYREVVKLSWIKWTGSYGRRLVLICKIYLRRKKRNNWFYTKRLILYLNVLPFLSRRQGICLRLLTRRD